MQVFSRYVYISIYKFWKQKICFTALLSFISLKFLSAQPVNIVTADSVPFGITILNFEYFVDPTGELPFDAVVRQTFRPLNHGSFEVPPFQGGWIRFKLQNTAQDASMSGVIKFYGQFDWINVWQGDGTVFTEQKSGHRFNCDRISQSGLDDCISFEQREGEIKQVYARLKVHDGQVIKIQDGKVIKIQDGENIEIPFIQLMTLQKAMQEAKNSSDLSWRSLFRREIFAQLIFFVLLVIIIINIFIREVFLTWYIAHLVSVFCYFSMNLAIVKYYRHIFCIWREWTLPMQIMATYAVLIFYISFSRVLLNVDMENKKLNGNIQKVLGIILFAAFIQIVVLCFFPLQIAFEFYNMARFVCLPIWLVLTLSYAFVLSSRLRWFIIIGSIAKILPAYFVFIHHVFPGEYRYVIDNIWRAIDTQFGSFYMYTIQIGILIEVFCFITAIAYKIREEKRKRDRLILRVAEQMFQIDALSTEMKTIKMMKSVLLKSTVTHEKSTSDFLQKVFQVVEDRLSDPTFGVEQLAQEMHLSRAQLHRKISDETGDSASQIILSTRLAKAMKMLQSTDQSVAETAESCGFSDSNYFAKVFKKYFDETPSDFREKQF
jgi:AraC-like DNA-binding protein